MWSELEGFFDVGVDLSKSAPETVGMVILFKACYYPFDTLHIKESDLREVTFLGDDEKEITELVKSNEGLCRKFVMAITFIFCGGEHLSHTRSTLHASDLARVRPCTRHTLHGVELGPMA